MKKISTKNKKIIWAISFWSGVGIIFLAASTLLVLWASGYKYNFLTDKFQKTGIIKLTSDPKNVDVYINNNLVKQKTPASFGYLLPGTYKVVIKKNNYQDWSQDVVVEPDKVSRFDNIILFYRNPTSTEISKSVQNYSLSPDKTKLIYQTNNFYLYNFSNSKSNKINGENLQFINWSSNSNRILFKNSSQFYYLDISNLKLSPIQLTDNLLTYQKLLWLPGNDQQFYILQNNNLYLNNINGSSQLLSKNIINFDLNSNNLFYTINNNQKTQLIKSDLNFKNPQYLTDLPSPDYDIISKNNYLFVNDPQNNFYSINQNNLNKISSQVNQFDWSENSSFFGLMQKINLVYKTSMDDIFEFNPDTNTNNLIYRTINPISKIGWYPDLNHILFQTKDYIKIVEKSGQNETTLAYGKSFEALDHTKIIVLDQNNSLSIIQIKE